MKNIRAFTKNIKLITNYFLGPVLFVWLSISIYRQVAAQPDLSNSVAKIREALSATGSWKFWLVLLLMLLNWCTEALKWKLLVSKVQKLSFARALKSVLTGVSVSVNTPNRIGEYGGRMLYIEERNRIASIALAITGSISQLLVTLVFGLLSILILRNSLQNAAINGNGLSDLLVKVLLSGTVLATVVTGLFYFRISKLVQWAEKIPALSKKNHYLKVADHFREAELGRILFLSFLRFLFFVSQYVLLLQLCGVEIDIWQGFWLISAQYLVMAIIPSIALADLGIRGKASLVLVGLYSNNAFGIITAAFGMWFINLVVPAIAGSLLILGIKIFRD